MRVLIALAVLLVACSAAANLTAPMTPSPTAHGSVASTPRPSPVAGCRPTRTEDTNGVITSDGRTGIVGETFAVGDLMNGSTSVVRRGATTGDRISVRFDQVGTTAPAKWVAYDVDATPRSTAWGGVVFNIGWKPIAFEDSCWRLVIDGSDTGIVLAVGH